MTLDKVKEHLRIDFGEEDNYLLDLIEVSDIYIETCVGDTYKNDEKAVRLASLLQLKLIQDMYENRGNFITNNTKRDNIVTTILDKLSNFI